MRYVLLALLLILSIGARSESLERDHTCFQTASQYSPVLDIGSDVAIVYGVNASFGDRVALWREKGYTVSMMTGIAWGGYGDYYQGPNGFRKEEVQTCKDGELLMHGNSTTVGYNVPSQSYIDYIKKVVDPAIDAGVQAIYLEEPEFWSRAGWSAGFKKEWELFYGEPWQAPDSSVDAQYRASKLKYELYYRALRQVFQHIKTRAKEKGIEIECHVPTHSLVNYAQWRIVSPESYLMALPEMDGYIAQVWTGTARSENKYRGETRERTFEAAYLEYGSMLGMVRPTGRKVWFLADPIEDNPNYSWNNYRLNYECTVLASLMWPEVHRFEVMPWPHRIFQGTYPKIDLDENSGEKEGIPSEYATELLAVINALNDMKQDEVIYDTGSKGIGVIISDTMMFQRALPMPSDPHLSSFFGLAMPLVKHGVPVEIVQLENLVHETALRPYKVLLLTYEGQKPLKPVYHDALAHWVKQGGKLIYVGDGSDRYHQVREWWNEQGKTKAKAYEDLFEKLGINHDAFNAPVAVGKGWVRVFKEKPRALAQYRYGADKVIQLVDEILQTSGESLQTQHYFKVQRGPYLIASVLDESTSEHPLELDGLYINLFDSALTPRKGCKLAVGERALLYDLSWLDAKKIPAKVVAAAARIREESATEHTLSFTARGPQGTTGRAAIRVPGKPASLRVFPERPLEQRWEESARILWVEFANNAEDMRFEVTF